MELTALSRVGRWALDFALPPRCAGCGSIIGDVHGFCSDCWRQIDFLGAGGCVTCGIPLEATEAGQCGACLAEPPVIARTRAAVGYGDIARSLAIRLKYGRKVALARTMARYMAPLIDAGRDDLLLVPVPLHRWRLWGRGFNQSALIAKSLSNSLSIDHDPFALRRKKSTPPLKAMSMTERRRAVVGAFAVPDPPRVAEKTVILIDDVLTTGATSEACARSLRRAGAERIELVTWARVIRPRRLQ
jgi:ComF family protein